MAPPQFPKALMPHPKAPSRRPASKKVRRNRPPLAAALVTAFVFAVGIFSMPTILAVDLSIEGKDAPGTSFPVTVIPDEKVIVYDPRVEAMLVERPSTLSAAVHTVRELFTWLAIQISEIPAYRQLAGTNTLFITIQPGYRQEQVTALLGAKLHWNAAQRAEFTKASDARNPKLTEGQFVPGTYFLSVTDPKDVEGLLHQRFQQEILARYSTSTAERVPLEDALTVASLIEREAGGWDDMRLISGIIWNRLFAGMNLQIDATLQYAKASKETRVSSWWPKVVPDDKYIKSAYNTYRNNGLPPSPIANPSIAAVLAALNPKQTDCLFYFHDKYGEFHCSPTYEGHVKLLKKHYGQGK